MNQFDITPFYCKYGCGKKLVWLQNHKMPAELTEHMGLPNPIVEHTFKRCADIQIEQGREPYFFDHHKQKKGNGVSSLTY